MTDMWRWGRKWVGSPPHLGRGLQGATSKETRVIAGGRVRPAIKVENSAEFLTWDVNVPTSGDRIDTRCFRVHVGNWWRKQSVSGRFLVCGPWAETFGPLTTSNCPIPARLSVVPKTLPCWYLAIQKSSTIKINMPNCWEFASKWKVQNELFMVQVMVCVQLTTAYMAKASCSHMLLLILLHIWSLRSIS